MAFRRRLERLIFRLMYIYLTNLLIRSVLGEKMGNFSSDYGQRRAVVSLSAPTSLLQSSVQSASFNFFILNNPTACILSVEIDLWFKLLLRSGPILA